MNKTVVIFLMLISWSNFVFGEDETKCLTRSTDYSFTKSKISQDKKSIGWIVEYPASFVSYKIPLKLTIIRNNKTVELRGNGSCIWEWHFLEGGKKVAYHCDTLHGKSYAYYECFDIEKERIIDKWQIHRDERKLPSWVVNHFETKP